VSIVIILAMWCHHLGYAPQCVEGDVPNHLGHVSLSCRAVSQMGRVTSRFSTYRRLAPRRTLMSSCCCRSQMRSTPSSMWIMVSFSSNCQGSRCYYGAEGCSTHW
jgi:hypothetical protein